MPTRPMFCTARLMQPFITVLSKHASLKDELEQARAIPIRARIGIADFHDLVTRWVRATSDPDLGLRAGGATCIGSGGPLDYALHTAKTLRESVALARRYAWLYSDALEFGVVRQQDRVSIQIGRPLCAPRAVTDFILSSWYRNLLHPHLDAEAGLVCSFSYPEPTSVAYYRSAFGPTKLVFDSWFDGFSFDHRVLDRVLDTADAALHDVHCEQLRRVDSSASRQEPWAMRVRRVVAAELHQGRLTSGGVARRLATSRRTLLRRLAFEGTTFTRVLDDLRRQRGLDLVRDSVLPLDAIATSLGFSHVQAFHRSFKRWTGMAPGGYRRTNARLPAAKEGSVSSART